MHKTFNLIFSLKFPHRRYQADIGRYELGQGKAINIFHPPLTHSLFTQINTFHWHVVDSQSFPLVVPGFTELAAKGAYNAQSTYSAAEVKDLVAYAAAVSTYPDSTS